MYINTKNSALKEWLEGDDDGEGVEVDDKFRDKGSIKLASKKEKFF
jgi:hypothetical protein